jgi:site-specific recombinase XerD
VALERFRSWRKLQHLQDRTRDEELRLLSKIRGMFPETSSPFDLTEDHVMGLFKQLRDAGAASKTQGHHATALRVFLKYLRAPAVSWIPAFSMASSGEEGRYLEDPERTRLWSMGCLTTEDEALLVLGLGAGWRRGDTLGAKLTDFLPSVEAAERVVLHGKGEKYATLQLDLHPKVREVLSRYMVYRTALVAKGLDRKPYQTDPGTLFVAVSWREGLHPMSRNTFSKRLHAIYKRAGVDPGGSPSHNLRRTWADNRLEALAEFYQKSTGLSPALALEMAVRQVCKEGRWKDEKTVRQSYFKRRVAPTEVAWAMTKV